MSKNPGKAAESAFVDYWTRRGMHVERLRDQADLVGLNKGMRIKDFAKPADFLVSGRGVALHYAEVKSTQNPRMFSFSGIKKGQSAAALREARQGAGSYLFYIWSADRMKWFIMPCSLYDQLLNEGRRSVTFEELEQWIR